MKAEEGTPLAAMQTAHGMRKHVNDLHRSGTAAGVLEEGVQQAVDKLRADALKLWPETRFVELTKRTPGQSDGTRAYVTATVTVKDNWGGSEQVGIVIEGPGKSGSGTGSVVIPAGDARKLAKALRGMLDDLDDLGWAGE